MQIAMVGLGKMGSRMTERLLLSGHEVVVFNRSSAPVERAVEQGAIESTSLEDLRSKLKSPRAVWIMVPAGEQTETTIHHLGELLSPGDTIIDGGNSNYQDTIRRAHACKEKGITLLDSGTSGGIWGLTQGYSLMVGGEEDAVNRLRPIFEALAPAEDKGWGHVGPSGAGHFVKMVHNGIEYGMMQAYAEGFEILKAKEAFDLDLHQVAEVWRFGSVVRSWLLDLIAQALEEDQELSDVRGWVADSGEGRWTVAEAMALDIPAPIITHSLIMRFLSREDSSYAAKLLAEMRNRFGGHEIKAS